MPGNHWASRRGQWRPGEPVDLIEHAWPHARRTSLTAVTSSSVPTPSKVVGTRSFSEPFVARRGQKPECQRGVAGTLRRAVALLQR